MLHPISQPSPGLVGNAGIPAGNPGICYKKWIKYANSLKYSQFDNRI